MPRAMHLSRLLGSITPEAFFSEHYLRRPLLVQGTAGALAELATDARCERIAMAGCDLLLVRDGKLWRGERPADAETLRARQEEGFTLVLRNPEPYDDALAALSRTFALELGGDINLHLYRTPGNARGFDWHCDPEEVFYLQASGEKRFEVRQNTIAPAPLLQTLTGPRPPDPSAETSEVESFLLRPGDWLYIPGGAWHRAAAVSEEPSASISVGVMAPTALDAIGFAMKKLAADPKWRARLPPLGRASPLSDAEKAAACHEAFSALGEALARELSSPELPMTVMVQQAMARMRGGR